MTATQIDEAAKFLDLVTSNNELLLEKFSERYNEYNEEFETEEKRVSSPAKIMRLAIYYTKLYNCYLVYHAREIVTDHFWEVTDIISEV